MTIGLKKVMAGTATLAIAGSLLLASAGTASAAATPPYEPDPISVGALTLYDASGNVITGGSINDAPFAKYVAASGVIRAGDTKATLYAALPKNGVDSLGWTPYQLSGSPSFPNTSAPAPLNSLTTPVVTQTATDVTLATLVGDLPNTATDAYKGLYQLRIKTSGGNPGSSASYASADIQITGNTWALVYPVQNTTTTLSANPSSPQEDGTQVTLTATISPAVAGQVQFKDGSANIGSSVAVANGTATTTWVATPQGTHSLSAVFTPSASAFNGSTGALSFLVNPPTPADTTTALSVNPSTANEFTPVALHVDVIKTTKGTAVPGGTGVVKFYDNSGADFIGQAQVLAGGADLTYSNFAAGPHQLTATFVPNAGTALNGSSTATPVTFTGLATDGAKPWPQNVTVNFPKGTLAITTPYTKDNPFSLGNAQLATGGQYAVASGDFGTAANPSGGVTVSDQRFGDLPWSASVTTTDFTSGNNTINGQNLAFLSVTPQYKGGDALNAATKPVVTNDVTTSQVYAPSDAGSDGLKGGPHQFATAAHGAGTVNIIGKLVLKAPVSTPSGAYTATVTFTVV